MPYLRREDINMEVPPIIETKNVPTPTAYYQRVPRNNLNTQNNTFRISTFIIK